jgi:acyl transferase domain-containing protein/acyl carrier protein
MSNQSAGSSSQQRVFHAFNEMRAKLEALERARTEPIAIVGAGCRLPGNGNTLESFWQLLRDGRDAITQVPEERWNCEALYDPNPDAEGKMCTRMGAFISGPIDGFDAQFFGITPREAANIDPQQRLLMEVTWESLENAGIPTQSLHGSRTGVFIGSFNNDYLRLQVAANSPLDAYGLLGTMPSTQAGRLSYLLGAQGPTLQIDTACSSSLVALHLACQSLRQGECSLALAGAVSLILTPEPGMYLSRMRVLAPDGYCKTFDASADGFARGEGCIVLALKRLSDAQANGDLILALIRGSAVNHDGRSNGLTAPNGLAQQELLRTALHNAAVQPSQVQYIEAHGTGTALGDPIELQALDAVMGAGHKEQPLIVGSVKTNIGHLEPVAGMAGLLKVILSLQHETLPPHLHLHTLNPYIPWSELSLRVPTESVSWPRGTTPRIAGVSSFGLTGTNAHIIVEEAPERQKAPPDEYKEGYYLLPLSARNPEALHALARSYQQFFSAETLPSLADICYTASTRRNHYEYRAALVGASQAELKEQLVTFLERKNVSEVVSDQHRLVFVFPGQGSQWVGMGKQLFAHEPVFRAAIERCEAAMRHHVSWSLSAVVQGEGESELLACIDVIQPLIFAVQISLAALWRSWGIQPDAVIGHSMGEIAAFYIAGALTLDDAVQIICQRSQLLRRISGQGSMALVDLSQADTRSVLAGYETRLSLAVSNSTRSTVISGETQAVEEVLARLRERDIFCRQIKVDVASHSPQVDILRPDLLRMLANIQPGQADIALYSTVTGETIQGGELDASYWVRNLRQPVLFADTIQRLREQGYTLFVEISPHPLLVAAIEEEYLQHQQRCRALPSLRRNEDERRILLESWASLYSAGYPLEWSRYYTDPQNCVQLPNYPWQHERFWLETREALPYRQSSPRQWEQELNLSNHPFLADHRVQREVVLPAAMYLEMALSVAQKLMGVQPSMLTDIRFEQMLLLEEQQSRRVRMVVSPHREGSKRLQILSRASDDQLALSDNGVRSTEATEPWTLHAQGIIEDGVVQPEEVENPISSSINIEALQEECMEQITGASFYVHLQEIGLHYGPAFQRIEQIWRGNSQALALLHLPTDLSEPSATAYVIHPTLLDASMQALLALLAQAGSAQGTYVPVGIGRVSFVPSLYTEQVWSYARLQRSTHPSTEELTGDILLANEQGQIFLTLQTLQLKLLAPTSLASHQALDNLYYRLQWLPYEPQQLLPATAFDATWLILMDQKHVGKGIQSMLEAHGATCIVVTPGPDFAQPASQSYQINPHYAEDWQRLLKTTLVKEDNSTGKQRLLRGILHFWSLDHAECIPENDANIEQLHTCESVLYLVQALIQMDWRDLPRLWLITGGVQQVGGQQESISVTQAPLWGLGRSIAYEQPRLQCTLVDMSLHPSDDEIALLGREIGRSGGEDQLALRGQHCYAARLTHYQPSTHGAGNEQEIPLVECRDVPVRLEITRPGILDQLHLRAITRRQPEANEVEIRVEMAGLNFLDVLKAMGVYPGQEPGPPQLGVECAGRIVALGENVRGLHIGEEVIAIASECFSSFVTMSAHFVFPKPANLSIAEAAAFPLVFLTAYYGLMHLGHLSQGERLLLHSAAGGTGLAAVQIARWRGAEIFATAGTAQKRDYLRSLGIQHVMDSRTLTFTQEVRDATEGEGVDVVFNSLTGQAADESLALLRPFGRFLEIGKKDIYAQGQLSLAHFRKNLTYTTIDVAAMLQQRPQLVRSLVEELLQEFAAGHFQPLPSQIYPLASVQDAFRTMAQGKHIGKMVVSWQQSDGLRVLPERSREKEQPISPIRANGTYLLTGGLGGIGVYIAAWMVGQGARHLVLVGRRPPTQEGEVALEQLRQQGAAIEVAQVDVSRREELAELFTRINRHMPPLRGVMHLAARLDDGTLSHLTVDSLHEVMAPKVLGTWNLHCLTRRMPLDFFVLFSSVSSLLGSQAQGNYSAANAFLDALACSRQQEGLPALSINWGAWAEIGLAAAQGNRGQRLALQGLNSMSPEQGVQALDFLLRYPHLAPPQVGIMDFKLRQWRQSTPYASRSPLFERLLQMQAPDAGSGLYQHQLLNKLKNTESGERREVLENHLCEQVSRILRLPFARVDTQVPLKSLGFDSLMAVELRNLLENTTGLTLSATLAWKYPTISILAEHLAEQLGLPLTPTVAPPGGQQTVTSYTQEEELLLASPDEASRLLSAELEDLPSEFLS